MDSYDQIMVDKKIGQVKLWVPTMTIYKKKDRTPDFGIISYSIVMREGGYVNVTKSRIENWTDKPKHRYICDKWGNYIKKDTFKMMKEQGYWFD